MDKHLKWRLFDIGVYTSFGIIFIGFLIMFGSFFSDKEQMEEFETNCYDKNGNVINGVSCTESKFIEGSMADIGYNILILGVMLLLIFLMILVLIYI